MDNLGQKRISEIISENYSHASVLFFFGISFYNYSSQTLEQVCKEKGLDLKTIIKNLESPQEKQTKIALEEYPVDLVIEYLKHSHYNFIKKKLPYISKLISNLENDRTDKLSKDLKFIFPFFVEDFIRHIYEEEDTLFRYILSLYSVIQKKLPLSNVYFEMEKHSIRDYALQHSQDDDEMQSIREFTENYSLVDPSDLHLKVIFEELKSFDGELKSHARIENEILFPKALSLENEISLKIKSLISRN